MGKNQAVPRFETQIPKGSKPDPEILAACEEMFGRPLPWQRKAIELISARRKASDEERSQYGDLVAGGVPRFDIVILTVPRRSGKTSITAAATKARAEGRERQRIWATAQSRDYARIHQETFAYSLPELCQAKGCRSDHVHYTIGAGRETVKWPNHSMYRIFTPDGKGGHGMDSDLVLIDEAFSLNSLTLGAITPSLDTNPLAQMVVFTTAGTVDSVTWNGLRDMGRASVSNPESTIGYIEYSAPDDEAVFDESRWGEWMPALGLTVSREKIRSSIAMMESDPDQGRNEIIRAYGNRTTKARVSLFPADWVERAWRVVDPPQRFVLALDVNDSPAGASVTTGHLGDDDGSVKGVSRLVEWRYGSPQWIPEFVGQLIGDRHVEAVVADFGGPAKQVQAEVEVICEAAGVPVVNRSPGELAADTARFYDDLREGRVVLSRSERLVEALEGAAKRTLRDMWLVSRSHMAVDASPLIASILANGLALELAVTPKVEVAPFFMTG